MQGSPTLRLAAVAAAVALVSSCTATVPGTGTAPPGAGAPPGLEEFYGQQLTWGPCAPFAKTDADADAFDDPALDCTSVTVPLDYAAPDGKTATIAVLRKRATGDPAQRIGSLLLNPGGPGASGTGFVPAIASGLGESPITQRFDLIGFDPRGVGASTPVIDCETDTERDEERADIDADSSPAGVALLEADSQEFVDRCVERTGLDFLANVGTREVVRDMDVMRAALGDAQLTYAGFSYGTFIGSKYAEAFPDRVRALLLDGAVDPAADPVQSLIDQGAGFQKAFDAFAADCVTRPDCALGTDAARATARYQELSRPLLDDPVPVGDGRVLGYNDATTGTVQALYSEQLWEFLRIGLQELAAGQGRVLMLLADNYEGRAQDGSYDNDLEAFPVITCVDDRRITDPQVYLEIDTRFREAAPFRDDGREPTSARPPCALWPVPPTSEPALPKVPPGFPPVLVISVTGDPATPYEAGVRLAEQLGARLLTAEGEQHTVAFSGVPCVDDIAAAYLVDLRLPDGNATCTIPDA